MAQGLPRASLLGRSSLGLSTVPLSRKDSGVMDILRLAQGPVRRVFLATFINALGNGLTLTLFVIYLTQVRHIPIGRTTLLLSWMAVVGLFAAPLIGTCTDRYGPRRVLMIASLAMAGSVASYSRIHSLRDAFIICSVGAIAGSGMWGPNQTMLAQLVSSEDRQRAFGLSFMILNLAIGLGGLVSTTIVSIERPETFELLYRLDGASFVLIWFIQLTLRGYGDPSAREHDEHGKLIAERGWGYVLRDRMLWRYLSATLILMVCGYGSVDVGLSYFAVTQVHLPVSRVGFVLLANTLAIVLAQIFVLQRIQGRSRTRLLAGVGLLWALSWAVNASALVTSVSLAVVVLCVGQVLFALGETIWAPVAPAIINDLAPDDVRGRYNSVQSLSWTLAGTVSPMLAGVFLQRGAGVAWILVLIIGCVVAAFAALALGRRISPAVDGRIPAAQEV